MAYYNIYNNDSSSMTYNQKKAMLTEKYNADIANVIMELRTLDYNKGISERIMDDDTLVNIITDNNLTINDTWFTESIKNYQTTGPSYSADETYIKHIISIHNMLTSYANMLTDDDINGIMHNYALFLGKIHYANNNRAYYAKYDTVKTIPVNDYMNYIIELINDDVNHANVNIMNFINVFKEEQYYGFNDYYRFLANIDMHQNYTELMLKLGSYNSAYTTWIILNDDYDNYVDMNGIIHKASFSLKFTYKNWHYNRVSMFAFMNSLYDELYKKNNNDMQSSLKAYDKTLDTIRLLLENKVYFDKKPDVSMIIDYSEYPDEFVSEFVESNKEVHENDYINAFNKLIKTYPRDYTYECYELFKINRTILYDDMNNPDKIMKKSCSHTFQMKAYSVLIKMINIPVEIMYIMNAASKTNIKNGWNNKKYVNDNMLSLTAGKSSTTNHNQLELKACDYIYDDNYHERAYRFMIWNVIRAYVTRMDAYVNDMKAGYSYSYIEYIDSEHSSKFDYLNKSNMKIFLDTGVLPDYFIEPLSFRNSMNGYSNKHKIPLFIKNIVNNTMPSFDDYMKLLSNDDKMKTANMLIESLELFTLTADCEYKKAFKKYNM